MKKTKDNRKTIGSFGEDLACGFLKRKGYKIMDRNCKLSYLEIDVVARRKKELIFVEVKTRATKDLGSADGALRSSQIKKLKKAMVRYSIGKKMKLENVRLDLISVDLDKTTKIAKIKHYKDIF